MSFKRAAELDPRAAEQALHVAEVYGSLRMYAEAERHYDRTISLSPDWARGHAWKAQMYLLWDGATQRARSVADAGLRNPSTQERELVVFASILIDIFDGNYQRALDQLAATSGDAFEEQFYFVPKAQLYAQIHGLMNHRETALAYYDSAMTTAQARVQGRPDDPRFHSGLGIAYAGLGRNEQAIREGVLASDTLMPVAKEAWKGFYALRDLAHIYVVVGEYDEAMDRIEELLSIPGELSIPYLQLDPTWRPLRDYPRFQRLVAREN